MQLKESQLLRERGRKKTSAIWKDFDEIEITKGVPKVVCKHCKAKYITREAGSNTSQMKRHIKGCNTNNARCH